MQESWIGIMKFSTLQMLPLEHRTTKPEKLRLRKRFKIKIQHQALRECMKDRPDMA